MKFLKGLFIFSIGFAGGMLYCKKCSVKVQKKITDEVKDRIADAALDVIYGEDRKDSAKTNKDLTLYLFDDEERDDILAHCTELAEKNGQVTVKDMLVMEGSISYKRHEFRDSLFLGWPANEVKYCFEIFDQPSKHKFLIKTPVPQKLKSGRFPWGES